MSHSCLAVEVFDEGNTAASDVIGATWLRGGMFTNVDRVAINESILAVSESRTAADGAEVVVRVIVAAGDPRVHAPAVAYALAKVGFAVPPGEYRPGAWVKAVRI